MNAHSTMTLDASSMTVGPLLFLEIPDSHVLQNLLMFFPLTAPSILV